MASATPHTMPRPRPVSIATYLLYILAAAPVVFSLIPLALVDDLKRAAERAYAGTGLAATAAASAATSVMTGLASGVVSAIVFAALAFFCGKGKNPARIIVWIFAGGRLLSASATVSIFTVGFFARKPGWYLPMTVASLTISILGLITASILLALPASRPFFRKAQASQPATPAPSEPANA